MSNFRIFVFFVLYISLLTVDLFSQSQQGTPNNSNAKGSIMGSMVDEFGKPVEFASIYVQNVKDSTTVQYAITNESGRFSIADIPFGNYFIEIQYVGYAKHYSDIFTISKENPVYKIPKFALSNKSTSLRTVEVKAQREMLQSNLDKTVYNVESNVTADGATAVEVLEEIPSVDVDIEGNVTLRGSENVTILIDGRPTQLTLDQIPAAMIESIEVITNPSARLEPDGMAGILNVVLKKKKESGFNGIVSLGGDLSFFQKRSYFDRYNGNINFNYSYDKINIFVNYGFRKFAHHNAGTLSRDSWFGTDSSHLDQTNRSDFNGYNHTLNTGLDWYINKKNTLNFSFGYQRGNNKNKSTLYSQNSNILAGKYFPYSGYDQEGESGGYSNNYNAAVNYKKTFEKKGQELTADLFFTQRDGESTNWYLQQFFIPDTAPNYFQKTKTIDLNRNGNAQIDFVTPIGNGGRIETGYKFSYRSIGQNYSLFSGNDEKTLEEDTTQTNNFIFSEFINAAYFIYSNTFWKKFKMQVGLRAELANTFSDLESADTLYKNNYFNLFPSVHLKYDINEKHAVQLSYSRRVSRPTVWQLNPFVDISDKQNLRKGNPNLTPEFANSLELGYMLNIKKSSLTLTAFYRQRSDLITRYTEVKEQKVDGQMVTYTMTSYENLNSSHNIGVELFYGQRIWKFWKINTTANFYRNIINSNNLIDENLSRDWAWGFRINQTFNLPEDWNLQLNFRYRSPSLTTGSMGWGSGGIGQGKRSANYSLNLGVKKGFFKNSLMVSLNIRDLLYSVVTKTHTYSLESVNGYDAWSERERDGYRISLNISYKINNYKKRQEKLPMEEEMEGEI